MNRPALEVEIQQRTTEQLGPRSRFRICAYQRLTSTQDQARALARDGAAHGTVVIAREQTRGRGRLGGSWDSAPGLGLYLSIVLRPKRPAAELPLLSLVTAVACAEALARAARLRVELKWPNDLIFLRRKLAGILAELELSGGGAAVVVVGIGLNLNHGSGDFPDALRRRAISLRQATGSEYDRAEIAAAVLKRFAHRYSQWEAKGPAPVLRRFRSLSPMVRGARVRVDTNGRVFSGITRGLDRQGMLIVATDDQRLVHLQAGEVHLLT